MKSDDQIIISSLLENAQIVNDPNNPKKREITGVILNSGVSQRRNYYSPEVVESATPMFEGVKMYIDHPAEKDAGKARSIRDWGATILEAYYEPTKKCTMARIGIRDPWLWENRILPANDGGYLDEIGISINAVGPTKIGSMDGQNVRIVEGIKKVFSADFVAEASAGGKVTEILESAQPGIQEELMSLENLTLDELVDVRPDLVEAIIQESAEELSSNNPEDIEIGEALLESQYLLADEIAALREDTALVVDEFLEGLQIIQSDLGSIMEGVQHEEGDYDDSQLMEGVGNQQAEYYVDTDPEVYEYLENLTEGQNSLAEENERLRYNMSLLTSQTLIERKLQESGLPEYAQERLRPALLERTSDEMDALIEGEREYLGEIIEESGGVPIIGAGGEATYEDFTAGMNDAAQQRLDHMFGVGE